jgi:tetratricopeptide (TPR) repeat protein
MKSQFAIALLLLIFLLAGQTHSASPEPATVPANIEQAVRELGAADYRTRERASKLLWQADSAAEAALRKALVTNDPEVRERAMIILDKLAYRIGPNTPQAVRDAIAQYKAGDRENAIRQLATLDMPGIKSLLAIQKHRPDENTRPLIISILDPQKMNLVSALLAGNESDATEQLLELCATTGEERHIRDHAAWLLIRSGLKDRIAQLQAIPAPDPAVLKQLVLLYRADGNLTNAIAYAVRLADPNLTRRLRYELGDWKTLATDPGGDPGIERLGFQAAYHRLSENKPAFEAALTNIHACADRLRTNTEDWFLAKEFLINGRPQDAVAALTRLGRYELAYQILMPWGHEDETFRIVALAREAKSVELPDLERAVAETLNSMAATNEARAIITGLIARATTTTNIDAVTRGLIESAKNIGLINEAAALAARAIGTLSTNKGSERQSIIWTLFPEYGNRADAWLALLRETAAEGTLAEHLARLHGYFTSKPESLRAFISLAEKAAPAIRKLTSREQTLLWQSLADAHNCLHETNLVVSCERRACDVSTNDPASYRRLALASANARQWPDSAAAARRANEIHPEPASLWASGWALAKAGDGKAGGEAMDRANLLALADEEERFALVECMKAYGAGDAAVAQQRFILLTGQFDSWEVMACLATLAKRAFNAGDFATATLMGERHDLVSLFRCGFAGIDVYVYRAFNTTLSRILANISQSRFEEAMEQARHLQEQWPCNTDLSIRLGFALEKAGRKDLATELFATTFTNWSALLRQYPNFVQGHNYIAWLTARMRRELPTGLVHARKAVELGPDLHVCRDTLAEVLFQLGRRDEAMIEMKKCVEQAPNNLYYRHQLKRMQEGDSATEPFEESD